MSKFVWKDAYIAINGTVFSDHASSVTVTDQADQVEFTAFSANSYREFGQGLKDATIAVTWFNDFAANSIYATLQPLYASGGTFGVEVRPTSAAVSATNPKATMTGRLYAFSIGGAVGDAATFESEIHNAGTAGLVWGTV